jgi:hypothetical protein
MPHFSKDLCTIERFSKTLRKAGTMPGTTEVRVIFLPDESDFLPS